MVGTVPRGGSINAVGDRGVGGVVSGGWHPRHPIGGHRAGDPARTRVTARGVLMDALFHIACQAAWWIAAGLLGMLLVQNLLYFCHLIVAFAELRHQKRSDQPGDLWWVLTSNVTLP